MTVEQLRRSPLADYPGITEIPFLTMVNVRVPPTGPAAASISARLGGPLPVVPGSVVDAGERHVLWLGPDEWLVVGPPDDTDLLGLLAEPGASIVDVSANRTTIEVDSRDLLEHGCTLDLHPRAFHAGKCAQTTIARTQVILWQVSDDPVYRLLVRGSFAEYLADWLTDHS
ncbi:sarcosine oxidase subunit gamma [Actinocrispum wychmicini]|uniref:Sarcosine oxidase subunit gamma n=1 Tax=Actinocrispum wychmicini TaxID=1213861 RepID=A0A4R2K497_9PSEU|nr:sarcosine oxidase subunit gamma family protein [Actinocrispum wychmicini]TCO64608.1 sarcosine oxidase subunit gamma [Actinocrispum wychmicini]